MKKQWMTIMLCLVVVVIMLAGCTAPAQQPAASEASSSAQQQSTAPVAESTQDVPAEGTTITDMLGNEVIVTKADKIVSLTPAGTEIVYALGKGDNLVGIDAFSNYPEGTAGIEIVGDYNGPDREKIVSLEPDVVLAGNTLQQDVIDDLKSLGLTVVCVEATTWVGIPVSIELIGDVIGTQEAAIGLVDDIETAVNEAQEMVPQEQMSVYYAMSYGDMGNWTSGSGSFVNTMIETAGGRCVTEDTEYPWVEYPLEDLVAANPDIILVASDSGDVAGISAAQGYQDLDAVKNGNVYVINVDMVSRPGPRIADGIKEISKIIAEAK